MSNDQDIRNQIEQLLQLRQNVQILLAQINAHGGWMHAPLAQLNSLIEQRREIAQCKAVLRGWQGQADDHPNDGPAQELGFLEQQISELEQSLRFPLPEAARQPLALLLQGAQERRRLLEAGQTLGPVVAAPLHAERDVYICNTATAGAVGRARRG